MGSFESGIAGYVGRTVGEYHGWEVDPKKGFVDKRKGVEGDGWLGDGIHWLLPDSYKRVFRLRPRGHVIVARLLVKNLEREGRGRGGEVDEL